ncbi:aldo/keto reductase [Cupriavidus basilensis]|uniref:Aldo/keto reductase n=1 Tax=Cupriavidus basilensis TaxID=68895 RepID=A0ABT6AN03_9BURK|nr:aldo/keto reductase [Cupriavidus basilensis]MDF3833995.1 aldo/keto reductase [Cupriavidus basilensis]
MSPDRRRIIGRSARLAAALGLACAAWPAGSLVAVPAPAPWRRPLPGSRDTLPVIGLGTANTFDVGPEPAERAPLAEVLALLLQTPGAVIDTAPSYGSAETVTGDLLQQAHARGKVFLATKISASAGSAAQAQWAQSLRALRSDTVDLLQVHNLIDWRGNLRFARQLKEQGKTRYIGITHYREDAHEALAQIVRGERLDFVQLNYSVAERNAERALLPLCQERGVAVLVNRPFQDGRLFRAVKDRPLPNWAGEIDCASWAQIFLKFIVGHGAVTAAIPATAKPRNMQDNLGAGFGRMPDARQRERIAALLA